MTSPTGRPVGAVHGFVRDLLEILQKKQPDYLFCAFDHPSPTFRHEQYEAYKEQREAMPIDLQLQMKSIRRMMEALQIPVLECPGYEADDILATLAHRVERAGGECYLVTGDKDCRQLITDRVKLYNIRKDQVFDAESLEREWGIEPRQVVDFQSLVGDPVDNVPGVPLIGPKIAADLLTKYDTLEGVLDHAGDISGKKRRENLLAGRQQALMSRELVRLVDNVPVPFEWEEGRTGRPVQPAAIELCREFGFRALTERLAGLTEGSAPSTWQSDYRTVASLDELKRLAGEMAKQPRLSIDTETTSTSPRLAEIVGCSFAWKEGEAYYVPLRSPPGEPQVDATEALEVLRPVLESTSPKKVGQNLKYDIVVFRGAGIDVQGIEFDTMVADYLLDPGQRNHSLDDIAVRYLNHTMIPITDLIGTGNQQRRMDEVPVEKVTEYAAEDADVPLRLVSLLETRLRDEGLYRLFAELEMPLIEVLAEMEFNGIRIDAPLLAELSERFGQRLQDLEQEIHKLAGGPFNIESRLQLSTVLFEKLGLPIVKRTKTGPSTDADVLAELAKLHDLPAKIVEYRQFAKLKSTYVDALPQLIHPETGRVHTSLRQDVAATGRLSSTEPNLQNIPIRTEVGREIRSAFLPGEKGWRLLSADYSQIELRVLAHFSGDAALQKAFAEDRDVHAQVAAEVYGVSLDDVTPAMRRSAKAVNFGVIYGQSPFGLARAINIDQEEAAQFIDAYFARYVGVDRFLNHVLEQCRDKGYVTTVSGRRRTVHGVRDPAQREGSRQRNLPERIAINTVIQGSAADIIKQAMIHVFRRLRRERSPARMLLQIHDELLFEAPGEEIEALGRLVTEEMSGAFPLSVPLKVDVKVGDNWAECEPWS